MIPEKYTQQIWILLAESLSSVVSNLSQPFWFVGKLIFCRLMLDVQSSCIWAGSRILVKGKQNFCTVGLTLLIVRKYTTLIVGMGPLDMIINLFGKNPSSLGAMMIVRGNYVLFSYVCTQRSIQFLHNWRTDLYRSFFQRGHFHSSRKKVKKGFLSRGRRN